MPATEQTWRDTKQLHIVFGISSLVMFVATVWLLAADHYREWKDYQRKFQQIENWTLASRADEEQTERFEQEKARLTEALLQVQAVVPPRELIERFVAQVLYYGLDPADAESSADRQSLDSDMARLAAIDLDKLGNESNRQILAGVLGRLKQSNGAGTPVTDAYDALNETVENDAGPEAIAEARQDLLSVMQNLVTDVRFEEDELAGERKFRRADVDVLKSKYDLGVRDGIGQEKLESIKGDLDKLEERVQQLTEQYESANTQRKTLEVILAEITLEEDNAQKDIRDHEADLVQLQQTLSQRTAFGRGVMEMPIIDAFNSPLQIHQIWLPELTLNNNFREVARFDRCTTCHLAIDKTAPGSAIEPGYPPLQPVFEISLDTPKEAPDEADRNTQAAYGFRLSEEGLLDKDDVTIDFVWPRSLSALAGLQRGDVLTHVKVGDRLEKLAGQADAVRYLIEQAEWGTAITLQVQRGFPHPYSSHPRLDLFVGSLSPHSLQNMGCTVCHDGQGSATEFKFSNHTPNDPAQAAQWARDHGWYDNHHWIFPMRPARFVESNCLKCHHEVTELEPSERFRDPPAPKLTEGYKAVKHYGCYGCHEINGYDGQQRIGPDLRNEPQYSAVALQLYHEINVLLNGSDVRPPAELDKADKGQLNDASHLADEVSWHPSKDRTRRELHELVSMDASRANAVKTLLADPGLTGDGRTLAREIQQDPLDLEARDELASLITEDELRASPDLLPRSHELAQIVKRPPLLSAEAHKLGELLSDVENAGKLRKAGPSLRYVSHKLGLRTIQDWILNPQSIRPTSRMPRFFGQHDHLSPETRAAAERYEPMEARAMATYLYAYSQPFAYDASDSKFAKPDKTRGKEQFETRGCLACHQHSGTPQSDSQFGPNLSNLAAKFQGDRSKDWLRSWLIAPHRYDRRTVMPNTYLEPIPLLGPDGKPVVDDGVEGEDGKPVYKMTDPAADIAEYLLGDEWSATDYGLAELSDYDRTALDELALEFLKTAFPTAKAKEYLKSGIPARLAGSLKGAELELLGDMTQFNLLKYVGRQSISRYGCSGCHDVPGFEGAKPIGTTLAEWGRKETSKLAFEHILHYLPEKYADHSDHAEGEHDKHDDHHLDPETLDSTDGYFVQSLQHHQREGFLRQKLIEPRSYDYEKAGNKKYHDRLRMPLFPWGAFPADKAARDEKSVEEISAVRREAANEEAEAVMTFVLGLVAEPPPAKYIYQPDARRSAIVQGEQVLQKYNCAGCHMLDLDTWAISFEPGDIDAPSATAIYPFLDTIHSPDQISQSRRADRRGRLHGSLTGWVRTGKNGHPEIMAWLEEDEEFIPIDEYRKDFGEPRPDQLGYNFELWEPTLLAGYGFRPKDPMPTIAQSMIERQHAGKGGDFARLLVPIALELVQKTEPTAIGPDAWAWVPPPLVGQGKKTQDDWLKQFLLNPHPIRPGVILRMPKFNMSAADAAALADYFAARDRPGFPDQFDPQTPESELEVADQLYHQRLEQMGLSGSRFGDALNIVINKAGCIACHGVADQMPEGSPRANGPNLANAYRRLQPDYMKRWIAKPSFTLPYTKMQELIPYDPTSPTLGGFALPILDAEGKPTLDDDGNPRTALVYHGTSEEQLQALVDLLSNFDKFLKSQTSISAKVAEQKAAQPTDEAGAE